jgi:serine protease
MCSALAATLLICGTARAETVEFKLRGDLAPAQAAVERHGGGEIRPLVEGAAAAVLPGLAAEARARAAEPVPDLADWYQATVPGEVGAAVAELRGLPEVADAYEVPEAPPPPATPDFTSLQGYFQPAPRGIDASFSRQDPRTRGAGVRIVDLEYNWNPFHEDLGLDWSTDLGGDACPRYDGFGDDHGTAVLGELAARENDYGVTGGAPDAEIRGISPTCRTASGNTSWRPAIAMVLAAVSMEPGDVLLIEQQTVGPNGGERYVPIEWMQSAFDATVLLGSLGIVVVATGGNGGENLDGPEFEGTFDRSVRDSGAILVGAGSSTDHARLGFSVYGSRMDLQGWGQNIATTGYGRLFGGTDPENKDIRYTATFGGTSGAGPIVTSAVAAIQSYLDATGQEPWSGARIAEVLARTGTPQGGDTSQRIGPLPDLAAALKEIEVDPPRTEVSVAPDPVDGTTVTMEAQDGWGSGVQRTEYRLDNGAWTAYEGPFTVTRPGTHKLGYRSTDRNDNVEATQTLRFKVRP